MGVRESGGELTMEPGDTLPWHEHTYRSSYVLEGGTLKIILEDRTVIWDFPRGKAGLGTPFGDIAINVGETTLKVIMHEFCYLDRDIRKIGKILKNPSGRQ